MHGVEAGEGGKAVGDKIGNVGRDQGSQRLMYSLEGHSVKSGFYSNRNGKTQEGFE